MSTKLETKDKEWSNIDYTNTAAYKTVKAFNKVGIFTDQPAPEQPGKMPNAEFGQLKRLRKLDSVLKPQKGPVLRIITHMHRQLVSQIDQYGKPVTKEYLTLSGEFRGTDWADMEVANTFEEGCFKNPKLGKVYQYGKRFDPETGEDLGKMKVHSTKDEYYIELPKGKVERKKFIDSIIDNAKGTFRENIKYYYKDLERGKRDPTFSYNDFISYDIQELASPSAKGGGSKTPGIWRDSNNKLRDKEGNLIQQ